VNQTTSFNATTDCVFLKHLFVMETTTAGIILMKHVNNTLKLYRINSDWTANKIAKKIEGNVKGCQGVAPSLSVYKYFEPKQVR